MILAFTGYSGAGKTTATKIFKEKLPNSMLIHGDVFMYASVKYYQDDFKRIFGISPLDIENDADAFRKASSISNSLQMREYLNIILPFIEKEIENTIESQQKSNIEFLIVEHFALPTMNRIWQRADYRILIKSSQKKRRIMLSKRIVKEKNFKENNVRKELLNREDIIKSIIENAKGIDYTIFNNYSKSLSKKIEKVCNKIVYLHQSEIASENKNKKILTLS